MAEDVARVARRVSEAVECGGKNLDLSSCHLTTFPDALYLTLGSVSQELRSISLAKNEFKSLSGKLFLLFSNLQDLNLEDNQLAKLPCEISSSLKLRNLNLCKNKFETFPTELTQIKCLENINLDGNQIKNVPLEELNKMPHLSSVSVKDNPVDKESLNACTVKFKLNM
ncbi:leucine-rich repeat-containing protein 20 [Gastrophryne carolinensis]